MLSSASSELALERMQLALLLWLPAMLLVFIASIAYQLWWQDKEHMLV